MIACLIFIGLLFCEFVTVLFGVSLLFDRINVFQIVFHFLGCITCIWQILDTFQYKTMWSIMCFFGLIPFLLEISVVFAACNKYKVINKVETI